MYTVGLPHPLQETARDFFEEAKRTGTPLCTSAEVLQDLVHVYLHTGRLAALDEAMALVASSTVDVWPLEAADVILARQLHDQYPALQARDLCYLASCQRRGVSEIKTFDETLAAAAGDPATN